MSLKPDAEQIAQFIEELTQQSWVRGNERRVWPRFLFHYTDISNAVNILEQGKLLSRKLAEATNQLATSSGSGGILQNTDDAVLNSVRFYFRPKTPTQFHAEGIRSKPILSSSYFPDAHCPVPVFLLFDSIEILSRIDCRFSNGNLGNHSAQPRLFSSARDLRKLPWRQIYHNTVLDGSSPSGRQIIFHRNSEAIVANTIDLASLRYIFCRSDAEHKTLLHLLSPKTRLQFQKRVISTSRSDFFFRKHTYIESVQLASDFVTVQFSPDTKSPGPYQLEIKIKSSGETKSIEKSDFNLSNKFRWKIQVNKSFYKIEIYLDGHIAYANSFEEFDDIPF